VCWPQHADRWALTGVEVLRCCWLAGQHCEGSVLVCFRVRHRLHGEVRHRMAQKRSRPSVAPSARQCSEGMTEPASSTLACMRHNPCCRPSRSARPHSTCRAMHFCCCCCCCCRGGVSAVSHALGLCGKTCQVQQAAEAALQACPAGLCPPGQGSSSIRPDHPAGDAQLRIPAGLRDHRSKAAQQR
jgi:hypothetical protein